MRWVRAAVVLVAVAVAFGAIVWISAFGFRDHETGIDCGVPIASAVHAKRVPRFVKTGSSSASKLELTNDCVGEARTRIGIALVVVLVSAAGATVVLRTRGPA